MANDSMRHRVAAAKQQNLNGWAYLLLASQPLQQTLFTELRRSHETKWDFPKKTKKMKSAHVQSLVAVLLFSNASSALSFCSLHSFRNSLSQKPCLNPYLSLCRAPIRLVSQRRGLLKLSLKSMEPTLNDLLTRVEQKVNLRVSTTSLAEIPTRSAASIKQYWIAVAGAPGSGKSTLCKELAAGLNSRGIRTTVVPMDGFHFYRRELDQMPNSEEAHSKRGSHWTFNATRLVQVILFDIIACNRILLKTNYFRFCLRSEKLELEKCPALITLSETQLKTTLRYILLP